MNKLYTTYANSDIYDDNQAIHHGMGYASAPGRTFVGWDANTSIKSDFNRSDFEYFRSVKTPKNAKDFMLASEDSYGKIGIIRNIIDLMADFASRGICIEHPVPRYERLFNRWFNRVKGQNRSERFLNIFYRLANVPVYRSYGKVSIKVKKGLMAAKSDITDDSLVVDDLEVKKGIIPLKYTFLDPMSLDLYAPEIAMFTSKQLFTLAIPGNLKKQIEEIAKIDIGILDEVPDSILAAILDGQNKVVVDTDRLDMYYYKKDDWRPWAIPMVAAILKDINLLEQMKLADMAALDGAISNIRLWTLGWKGDSAATAFIPTKAMIERLRNILSQNVGGGVMDLVWGPELMFTESKSEVYKFLGSEKYSATLDAIYDGMGIPPTLRSGSGTTNTNNFMSLKTLVERLNYGRDTLKEFWTKELAIVQKALGIVEAPTITFDAFSLSDEAGEKKLLIELLDRNIISDNKLREKFGLAPDIEEGRVRKEFNQRGEYLPEKSGPFYIAEKKHDLRKVALTTGQATPSEVGLELEENDKGQKTMLDQQAKQAKIAAKNNPTALPKAKTGSKGRPKNVVETSKRKPKPKNIRTLDSKADIQDFAAKFLWASEVQNTIADIVIPKYLSEVNKPNVRSLSKAQAAKLEDLKYGILFSLSALSTPSEEMVYNLMQENKELSVIAKDMVKELISTFHSNSNREPTIDEQRQIYATAYAVMT